MDIGCCMEKRGNITIEASLIFPFVLLVLASSLYIIIYAHEMTCLKSLANCATLEVQKYYENTDYVARIENGLYMDCNFDEAILQQITSYINEEAKKQLIVKDIDALNVEVNIKNYMVYQSVEVEISKGISIPRGIREWINGYKGSLLPIKAVARTRYLQPTKCVRGVDFIDDLSSEVYAIKPLKDRYNEILEKIEATIHEWI